MAEISTLFDGCVVVTNDVLRDSRGYFVKAFQKGQFVNGLFELDEVDEIFWTESSQGVARGLHLQVPPMALSKYVICTNGHILDLILDLRSDSDTFGQIETVELGPENGLAKAVFVPRGFAHGFITLSSAATVAYVQRGKFSSDHDTGVSLESFGDLISKYSNSYINQLSPRDKSLYKIEDFPLYSSTEWLQNS